MSLFTFDETKAMETTGGNSLGKVLDSGVYDIEILTASKTIASTGTTGIDWSFQVDGAKYPNHIYGMWVAKADGTPIFNMAVVQNLMGILGIKELTEYDKTIEVKDGTKVVKAFKELDNVKCKAAIQKVYGFYNGEVTEKNEFKMFFSMDCKTYAEMKSNSDPKQCKYFEEKLADKYDKDYLKAQADGLLDGKTEDAEETTTSLL